MWRGLFLDSAAFDQGCDQIGRAKHDVEDTHEGEEPHFGSPHWIVVGGERRAEHQQEDPIPTGAAALFHQAVRMRQMYRRESFWAGQSADGGPVAREHTKQSWPVIAGGGAGLLGKVGLRLSGEEPDVLG